MKETTTVAAPRPVARGYGLRFLLGITVLAGVGVSLRLLCTSPNGDFPCWPGSLTTFAGTLLVTYGCLWTVYLASGPNLLRARCLNCLLANAALVMTVLLLELPTLLGGLDYRRIIVPRPTTLFAVRPWQNPGNRLDPDLLHIHQPHQYIAGTSLGDLVDWYGIPTTRRYDYDLRYDRNGFRNPLDLERAAIALIGDSFVESPLVSQDQLLSARLATRLDVAVANLGQAGYGPQQELVVLRRFALPLQPHVVLWLLFEGNDLSDFRRYEQIRHRWTEHVHDLESWESRSFTRNALLALASWMPQPPSGLWRTRGCAYGAAHAANDSTLYFGYGDSPDLAVDSAFGPDNVLTQVTDVMHTAATTARDSRTHLIFVYVPTKLRVYQPYCECAPETEVAHWRLADLPAYFERWSRAEKVPFLDLTPALRAAAADGELVFFPDDDHWNARAQEIAAGEITEFLRQKDLL